MTNTFYYFSFIWSRNWARW